MKKNLKLIAIFALLLCILNVFSPVFAADNQTQREQTILDIVFGKGNEFFEKYYTSEDENANKFIESIFENGGIIEIITTIGYLAFFIAGAILGIKYMMSGYEGKAFVKNGLVSYSIGAIFFYLSENVVNFVRDIFFRDISQASNLNTLTGTIWSTFEGIISVLMVGIVVFYGVKYMWSSSNEKADLKKGMVPMVIGAILIMCTLQILQFVVDISEPVLEVSSNNIEYQQLAETNYSFIGENK